MDLNTIRRMAGVSEVFAGDKAEYTVKPQLNEANEVSLSKNINEITGKTNERFILVHDPLSEETTPADMIAVMDGPSFANVFIGAHSGTNDAKVAAKENWTLYHFTQMNRALADVNARLKKAGVDTVVTESKLIEDCGQPHGENEEEIDPTGRGVDCPICDSTMPKEDFYGHMMDKHKAVMRGPYDDAAEDEEMNYEDEEAMNYKSSLNKGQHVEYNGQPHIVVVPDAQGDFVGIAPIGQEDDPDAVNLVHAREIMNGEEEEMVMDVRVEDEEIKEAEDATVWDKAMDDKDESPESPKNDDVKVTVPPKVKSALKKEIKELQTAAEKVKVSDAARAEFYTNSAAAMQKLLDCLDYGTMEGVKKAQIHMTSLMSPIVQRIPDVAHDFITGGGEPTTLKNLFKKVKEKK